MQKILIVDDEESICEILQFNLEIEGYDVDVAYSAEQALRMDIRSYSLILLDVMMGEMSGLELVTAVRENKKTSEVPIIVCTALGDEQPLVDGFTRGADDYIKKPFSMREFVLRVQRLLKRFNANPLDAVKFGDLELDVVSRSCMIDGEEVMLTKREFDLLHLFLTNRNKIFTRDEILRRIWEKNIYVVDRTIDVNINRLRKKLGKYESNIITKQGYGYGFKD